MCLLTQQPKTTVFSEEFIRDVYVKNSDGFGVMYAEGGKIHIYKCIPADADEMVNFYNQYASGRDCIWHARMKTHGDIDMDNCHPYRVTDEIWLAHNGVLSSGNEQDTSKSDTWHFIKNVMRPALSHNPDLMLDPEWCRFIAGIIGSSNKFGLLRSDGEFSIINEKSGVNFEGAWLSNTYAWSPSRFGFRPPATNSYSYSHGGYMSIYEAQGYDWDWTSKSKPNGVKQQAKAIGGVASSEVRPRATSAQISKFIRSAYNSWSRRGIAGVEQWVFDAPEKAAALLCEYYSDVSGIEALVQTDPEEAAAWIDSLFASESVSPSYLS